MSRKNSRALFRARYLCDAGYRSEVVIPLLMEELKRLVRFGPWIFVWCDAQERPVNSLTSPQRQETTRYFIEHFDRLAVDCGFSTQDIIESFPPVSNPWRTGRINPRMDETESYRVVWGPEGLYFNLVGVIRDAADRVLGVIELFRAKGDADFDDDDEEALHAVLPYLRRLLECDRWRASNLPLADDGPPGVAVFDEESGPLFISERAFALATTAFNERMAVPPGRLEIVDPAFPLRAMFEEVRASYRLGARDDASGFASTRTRSNAWGTFTFDWERSERQGREMWSVVVRNRVPIYLRVMATSEGAALSDRQLEVCRGLLDGEPVALIASRIGVTPGTLKDHARELYRKFGVRDRDGLLRKVIGTRPAAERVPGVRANGA